MITSSPRDTVEEIQNWMFFCISHCSWDNSNIKQLSNINASNALIFATKDFSQNSWQKLQTKIYAPEVQLPVVLSVRARIQCKNLWFINSYIRQETSRWKRFEGVLPQKDESITNTYSFFARNKFSNIIRTNIGQGKKKLLKQTTNGYNTNNLTCTNEFDSLTTPACKIDCQWSLKISI